MATKKPKKLNRDRVIADLKLLAAGADGWMVVTDDDRFPTLLCAIQPDGLSRLCFVIREHWFADQTADPSFFSLKHAKYWESFDTLADCIVEERLRIDRIEASAGN